MRGMLRLSMIATLLLAAACGSSEPPADWPEGSYCVLRDGACPRAANGDFVQGTILIDTDNEGADISAADGAVGSSTPGGPEELARLQLCCGSFGPSELDFPADHFALPAGGTQFEPACPDAFAEGEVFIDAEDDSLGEDADTSLEGQTGGAALTDAGNLSLLTCESTPDLAGDLMPEGHYCVFAGDDEVCPPGMEDGLFVTDDEDSGNIDMLTGEVGGITQADSTTFFPFCCQ